MGQFGYGISTVLAFLYGDTVRKNAKECESLRKWVPLDSFEDAIFRIAELWHFLGREGVPIAYTWPAGHPGLLRGYNYDRESP